MDAIGFGALNLDKIYLVDKILISFFNHNTLDIEVFTWNRTTIQYKIRAFS